MNFGWIKGLAKSGSELAVKHAPEILMGVGTVSIGSGLIFALKAGPIAETLIDEAEEKKAKKLNDPKVWREPLDWLETLRTVYRVYIPPIGLTLFGLGCFWTAHGIDMKRQAVLLGLYSTAEASLEEYQRKVIELMGQKKHEDIKDAIAEDNQSKTEALPMPPGMPGAGATDIWFNLYGDTFPCNYVRAKEAQNELNHEMLTGEMFKSVAELKFKLDPSGQWLRPKKEDFDAGWTLDRLLVLHIANPFGPIATVTYEDKDGVENMPVPGFMIGH